MRTSWRVGSFFLLLAPLAGCSDDKVDFPSDAAAEAGVDVAVDVPTNLPDADASAPDVSADRCTTCDVANDNIDTGAPEARPDTIDVAAEPDATDDGAIDAEAGSDTTPPPDATDDVADATSEDAPETCATRCASGVCDSNGNCTPCVKDSECSSGLVCNAGTCGPRCGDGGTTCTGNLVCCNDHCVDTTRDPRYCGSCGTTCSATQFCGNASTPVCRDVVLRNVCNTKRATFLRDGTTDDDAASQVVQNAIAMYCVPAPTMSQVGQGLSTAINPTTGQPLVGGGELLVAAGGDSLQKLVRYLETSGTSTAYNLSDGVTYLDWMRRGGNPDGGDTRLLRVDLTMVSPTHDYFLVEVVKDPITGTFSFVVYGVESPGTKAGAFYFANVMLPSIVGDAATPYTDAWYIVDWTASADAGTVPSTSDTYTSVATGM
ncbi:MAG: hypothetical protein ABW133_04940 [Polyangiaceae bacterium]